MDILKFRNKIPTAKYCYSNIYIVLILSRLNKFKSVQKKIVLSQNSALISHAGFAHLLIDFQKEKENDVCVQASPQIKI